MRLPADATLIVLGAPDPGGDAAATANVAALIEAWRREDLPAVDARTPGGGAFETGRLEERLDEIGATTLVLCGEEGAVMRAARDAAALGFHAFICRDACSGASPSPAITGVGEAAGIVETATALAAAAVAKARQRRGDRGRS